MNIFSPNIAYASLDSFVGKVGDEIINPLITLLFALAVVYFLYGVFEFLANQDSEEKKTTGKSHMIWGVIGIAIMMGVWGIMKVVINTFNINSSGVNVEIDSNSKGAPKVELNPYTPPTRP